MLLSSRIGERFDAMCTGAADKGTWVRIFHPPIEGRLLYGYEGVDVGNRLRVQLIHTDVEKGYIDFKKILTSRLSENCQLPWKSGGGLVSKKHKNILVCSFPSSGLGT